MAKKKSAKKSEVKVQENNNMVSADLSNLIDAAKSSFLEFNTTQDTALGAERATVLESEDVEDVKAAVNFLEQESVDKSETVIEGVEKSAISKEESTSDGSEVLESLQFKHKDLDFIEESGDQNESSSSDHSSLDFMEQKEGGMDDSPSSETIANLGAEEDLFSMEGGEELFSINSSVNDNSDETPVVEDLIAGSELEGFDSAAIEELEFIEETQLESVIESVLFATDRPVSIPSLKQIFKGTNVSNARLKKALETLQVEYAGGRRGVTLEEVGSGYQLRTKVDNMEFLRRSFKAKSFKLSGPALEVLAITAYKQPLVKAEIDEIRGVESGHLLRALMEKNLVLFAGKSDLPGKPMQYATTRKFLEIFGLRNLKELPTLSQIDELLPDGIGDEEEKPKLADITEGLIEKVGHSYSEGEEELLKISDQLDKIDTSSEFFEKEKLRQKQERDAEKARNLQDAIAVGEEVSTRDRNWLKKYEEQIQMQEAQAAMAMSMPASTDAASESLSTTAESEVTLMAMAAMEEMPDDKDMSESEGADLASQSALDAWDLEMLEDESKQDQEDLAQRLEDNDVASIDEEI